MRGNFDLYVASYSDRSAAAGAIAKHHEEKMAGEQLEADDWLPADSSAIVAVIEDEYLDRVDRAVAKATKKINKAIDKDDYDAVISALDEVARRSSMPSTGHDDGADRSIRRVGTDEVLAPCELARAGRGWQVVHRCSATRTWRGSAGHQPKPCNAAAEEPSSGITLTASASAGLLIDFP